MTNEQLESLTRVKATWAYGDQGSDLAGTYHTADIGNVLETMRNQQTKLLCVVEDLRDLKGYLDNSPFAIELIDSLLLFVEEE